VANDEGLGGLEGDEVELEGADVETADLDE
jgi:hypothetical protein